VIFREISALAPLLRGDHMALAEAFLDGRIDIEGDASQVMFVTDELTIDASLGERIRSGIRFALTPRVALNRASVSFHYDRPPGFFTPWLERWRSYSHGFYTSEDDDASSAQARKMQHAIDALRLGPGAQVLDMGGGWGCFVEYAGLQGIHVHSITISREQYAFVRELIEKKDLPCTVELVDFMRYRPDRRFDGAVFMGTLEHVQDHRFTARFLARHLTPSGAVYADFCSAREGWLPGDFLRKHLWPGAAGYVVLPELIAALLESGFNVHELGDDTLSYALTVRDWGRRLEVARSELASLYGEPAIRTFLLFLWASEHFLRANKTQAYHLVAARCTAPLRPSVP
jgi:cyclopropane-fatty-acyl-phospholipid synthase